MLQQGTIHVARRHALQLIEIERKCHIFWEIPIQQFFMKHPTTMMVINWLYSFIHIPGTIAFLVWLYYYLITRNRLSYKQPGLLEGNVEGSPAGPALYEARRRTMAVCNLLAFVVFTLWPCMPPRLLSDTSIEGPDGVIAKSFGFVDTVHGKAGAGSVWTENRFCNQYGKFFSRPISCDTHIKTSASPLVIAHSTWWCPRPLSAWEYQRCPLPRLQPPRYEASLVLKIDFLFKLLTNAFANSQFSCNAITPFRVLSADWLDDHDRPTIPRQSTREVTASTVLQPVAPKSCAPDPATVQIPAVVHNLGLSLPFVDPDCHYCDRESFHS
jgi:hypothetical protein